MEGLPDAAAFATRLKNTLIQYHSIEDDEWRIAKKTVNRLNYIYLAFIFYLVSWLMTFKMVRESRDHPLVHGQGRYLS